MICSNDITDVEDCRTELLHCSPKQWVFENCLNISIDGVDSEQMYQTEEVASNKDPCDDGTTSGHNLATDAVTHTEDQSSNHTLKVKSTPRYQKAFHSDQKIFACNHCDYKTILKTSLAKRFMIHYGELPFA